MLDVARRRTCFLTTFFKLIAHFFFKKIKELMKISNYFFLKKLKSTKQEISLPQNELNIMKFPGANLLL